MRVKTSCLEIKRNSEDDDISKKQQQQQQKKKPHRNCGENVKRNLKKKKKKQFMDKNNKIGMVILDWSSWLKPDIYIRKN